MDMHSFLCVKQKRLRQTGENIPQGATILVSHHQNILTGSMHMGGRLKFLTFLLVLFACSSFAHETSDSFRGGDFEKFPQHSHVEVLATQYTYTGAYQTINVPAGAITMVATLYGGAGGTVGSAGGNGAMIAANIPVSAGQILYLWVGGAASGIAPGWNGGGAGSGSSSGGGGGATDLRTSGNSLNDRILVAGGGGGASTNCGSSGYPGGGGGYPTGLSGPQCSSHANAMPGTKFWRDDK